LTAETSLHVAINPSLLPIARTRVQLDVDQARDIINRHLKEDRDEPINASEIQAWEAGKSPTLIQAEAIAKTYLIPFAALFQEKLPPPGVVEFRLGPQGQRYSLSYDTLQRLERFSRLYLAAKSTTSAVGAAEDVAVPVARLDDVRSARDVETLASQFRDTLDVSNELQASWKRDEEALSAWRQALERLGIFVFVQSLPVYECRGASRWEPSGPPAILINSADLVAAQIFTLMHEFVHLAFSRQSRPETILCDPSSASGLHEETVANKVAAAILIPKSLLQTYLPSVTPDSRYRYWPHRDRASLKQALNVSHAVIGIRLKHLGIVADAGVPQSFWRKVPPKIRGKSRPVWQRYRRYLGAKATGVMKEAVERDVITVADLSRMLGIKAADVGRLLA
jgi:Zn-dependent peptidase ImmA (M78 family)